MSAFLERIADEWRERSGDLASWTFVHLVNRTDVWGRYVKRSNADSDAPRNPAITAPFREERGKVFLTESSLQKHFKTRTGSGVLGVHSTSSDLTSRWFAIDVDLHDPDDLSVTPEGNFVAAKGWWQSLLDMGFDPLLFDSNGKGGFHILALFAEPMSTKSIHQFVKRFTSDYAQRGVDAAPEIFPGKPCWNHYGSWLRLPGRHHTKEHYTRVWNDEPWTDEPWLEGHDAIERILRTRPISLDVANKLGIQPTRRTICLDFDGVIHSYRSGWCGAEIIPDPPIHGSREAIERLRANYRVVIHSARCQTKEGLDAIEAWLVKHGIEVDEVSRYKPPAFAYVDDRAIPFDGNWDQAIGDIHQFRR